MIFDFLKKLPSLNEMTGGFGEWLAKIYSKKYPNALTLTDVLIDGVNDYTSQIDLIMIGNRGVYIIEVKTFPDAKIYGDTKSAKWVYYSHGNKYEIYSPIKQNKRHIDYLKSFLKDFGDIPCYSIILMMCIDFKVSGEYSENTILCNSLPAMDRGIEILTKDNPEVFDDIKKREIFNYIKDNQRTGKEERKAHKQRVIEYKESLDQLEKEKICPYCKTELVLRKGKNGEFYGCKNFPKCRYTLNK